MEWDARFGSIWTHGQHMLGKRTGSDIPFKQPQNDMT